MLRNKQVFYSCEEQLGSGVGISGMIVSRCKHNSGAPVSASSWLTGGVLQLAGTSATELWQQTELEDTDCVDMTWYDVTWLQLTDVLWSSGDDCNCWHEVTLCCSWVNTILLAKHEVPLAVTVHVLMGCEHATLATVHVTVAEQTGRMPDDTVCGGNDTNCCTCMSEPVRLNIGGIVRCTSCPLCIRTDVVLPDNWLLLVVADVLGAIITAFLEVADVWETNLWVFAVLTMRLPAVTGITKPLAGTEAEESRWQCKSSEFCEALAALGNLWPDDFTHIATCCWEAVTLVVSVHETGIAPVTDPGDVKDAATEWDIAATLLTPHSDTGAMTDNVSAESIISRFIFCTGNGKTPDNGPSLSSDLNSETAGDGTVEDDNVSAQELFITGSHLSCNWAGTSRLLSVDSIKSSSLINCTLNFLSLCNLRRFFCKLSSRLHTQDTKVNWN